MPTLEDELLSDELRQTMIRGQIAAGTDPAHAPGVVDTAFLAARDAVAHCEELCDASGELKVNARVLAYQLCTELFHCKFENAKAILDAFGVLSVEYGDRRPN